MSLTYRQQKIEKWLMFIAVFFSSIAGAQFLGISINKLAIIPIEIYLFLKYATSKNRVNKIQKIILLWYFFSLISCLFGLLLDDNSLNDFTPTLINYILQVIFIYCPVLVLIRRMENAKVYFEDSIIIVAKINAIWAVIQFVCWYGFRFDLNNYIFNNVFRGVFGGNWALLYWDSTKNAMRMRICALNVDAAFFAIIIVFGFCFIKSKLWKYIFFGVIVISMSRTGVVAIIFVLLRKFFLFLKNNSKGHLKIKRRKFLKAGFLLVMFVILLMYMYYYVPIFKERVDDIFFRFGFVFNQADSGTERHLLYLSSAFQVWATDFSVIRKMLGYGPRVGGVALTKSCSITTGIQLNDFMRNNVWMIECDYAEMLLGRGVFGFLIYYVIAVIYKHTDTKNRIFIITLALMCLMYNYMDFTLVHFWLIVIAGSCYKREKDIRECYS